MDKFDKQIMVVSRDILFTDERYFQGFRMQSEYNYESIILDTFEYRRRGSVEEDHTYKQPIGYAMVVNPSLQHIFAYLRSSEDSKYTEKRLQGMWSWGVGGHIEKIDAKNGNPIRDSLMRELGEEVKGITNPIVKVLGYINDDSNDIGKVHFGILYFVETNSTKIEPNDSEIVEGRFMAIDELDGILSSENKIEAWSEIALGPLKEYFRKL